MIMNSWVLFFVSSGSQNYFEIEFQKTMFIFEPWHEISNNVVCAASIASDQPAHTRKLIRDFASRLNILWLLSYWMNLIWSF